jgi:hypothetical protein
MTEIIPQKTEELKEGFSYSSRPRPLQARRKYRNEPGQAEGYRNLMFDRRIVRGNTYAREDVLPVTAQEHPVDLQRKAEKRRAREARKRQSELEHRTKSPPPVDGRRHQPVQTELYLEEITDRIEESEAVCQTDAWMDRPPTPLFVPAKTGADISTQILPGDLFDFDRDVKPILEVIVGKTMEQSMLEVMEEEELENLRDQQRRFQETRKREQCATQRLEEQELRLTQERERRISQQREVRKKEKETAEKIAARAYAQDYLMDMIPAVFGKLKDSGFFFDPVARDIETNFIPSLLEKVKTKCDEAELAQLVLDELIRHVIKQRLEAYSKLSEAENAATEESS